MENGAFVLSCSDMHYGHRQNLILPGRSTHMGDGWETKRRRGPGHDWSIIRLARRGRISRIELDTDHFKGNAPGKCMLEYTNSPETPFQAASAAALENVQPRRKTTPKINFTRCITMRCYARQRTKTSLQRPEAREKLPNSEIFHKQFLTVFLKVN